MAKRKLSKQQRLRIAQNQKQRTKSQSSKSRNPEPRSGELTADSFDLDTGEQGLVISHFGQQLDVECLSGTSEGQVIRCHQRANLPQLVTGDKVIWQADGAETGVVVALQDRISLLDRPNSMGEVKPVAANIDLVVIVIAPKPEPFTNLIDRYLIAVENLSLSALLVVNKMDLLDDDPVIGEDINNITSLYDELDYPVHSISVQTGAGLEQFHTLLQGKTAVFVGQSGVGKSSLINLLHPDAHAEVGALSVGKAKGTHTTTTARLFHLQSCDLIDSPGIREFGLGHISTEQVFHGFREFSAFANQCRFNDCAHRSEPDCALQAAAQQGKIKQQRLDSYFQILQTQEGR